MPLAHVREIIRDPNLFDIWCTLPLDITLVMCHVVYAMMLIWSLQDHAWCMSSSEDEAPSATHLDSPLAQALGQ